MIAVRRSALATVRRLGPGGGSSLLRARHAQTDQDRQARPHGEGPARNPRHRLPGPRHRPAGGGQARGTGSRRSKRCRVKVDAAGADPARPVRPGGGALPRPSGGQAARTHVAHDAETELAARGEGVGGRDRQAAGAPAGSRRPKSEAQAAPQPEQSAPPEAAAPTRRRFGCLQGGEGRAFAGGDYTRAPADALNGYLQQYGSGAHAHEGGLLPPRRILLRPQSLRRRHHRLRPGPEGLAEDVFVGAGRHGESWRGRSPPPTARDQACAALGEFNRRYAADGALGR